MELPRIPALFGALVAAFPQYPHGALLSAALNLFARNLFAADETARLDGKVIRLHVRDAGLRLTLRIARNSYAPCRNGTTPDATVSADAREFLLLALGSADPDTLFFDRRLTIAGDTEVGLLVKNALDRVVLPLPASLLQFLRSRLS
jgi:O2-independent ubiquinone biosynthesis accessory factor UbiT